MDYICHLLDKYWIASFQLFQLIIFVNSSPYSLKDLFLLSPLFETISKHSFIGSFAIAFCLNICHMICSFFIYISFFFIDFILLFHSFWLYIWFFDKFLLVCYCLIVLCFKFVELVLVLANGILLIFSIHCQ